MTKLRLAATAALTAVLSGALACAPVLSSEAAAKTSKAHAKAKAAIADSAATDAAARDAATPAAPATPPEQQVATSNPAANIPAVLQASGQFTILLKAATATNLTPVLASPARPLTVFAPTDTAFNALPPGTLAALMQTANAATLQKILTYHVVATKLPGRSFKGHAKSPVPTAANVNLMVDGSKGAVKVNDATVIQSDVQASNGVIHVIDKVLVPPGVNLPAPSAGAAMGSTPAPAMADPGMSAPTAGVGAGGAGASDSAPSRPDPEASSTGATPPQL